MAALKERDEFDALVAFHGCYCLDIALGYRVVKALTREMGDELRNPKQVVAYAGAPTCGIDALQQLAGCTLGKRNLFYTNTGKSTFVLHNTVSGKAVRAYCHYWDDFDHEGLRCLRQAAKETESGADKKQALQTAVKQGVETILALPEDRLFTLSSVSLPAPPASAKYRSEPCAKCGEFAKHDLLIKHGEERVCAECATWSPV